MSHNNNNKKTVSKCCHNEAAFESTSVSAAAAVPAVMRADWFNLALRWLSTSSSFKVELPRFRFSRQCDQTRGGKKKWHLLSFLLSWARVNAGETGASAHFTPLILLEGRRAGWGADYFTYLVPQLNRDHNHSFFQKMWWKKKAVVLRWLNLEPGDSWLDDVSGLSCTLLAIPQSRLLPGRRRSVQSLTFQEAGGHGNGIFDVDMSEYPSDCSNIYSGL